MTTTIDHERSIVTAALDSAWLRHRGPDDADREFRFAGEFIPVLEGFAVETEVSLYPAYGYLRDGDDEPHSWSLSHPADGWRYVECWQWAIGVGWDDLDEDDDRVAQIEDLGGCWDDRQVTFIVTGSHQAKPPIPDELIQALAVLDDE